MKMLLSTVVTVLMATVASAATVTTLVGNGVAGFSDTQVNLSLIHI